MDDTGANAPAAVAFTPPPRVSRLATSNGLGRLLGSRKLANPFADASGWLVVSLACFAVLYISDLYLPTGLADSFVQPVLRFVAVLFFLLGMAALAFAVRVLAIGARAYFIYSEGFVYLHNGKAAMFGWSDVTGLKAIYGMRGTAGGKPRWYQLRRTSGRPVGVPLNIVDGRDPFVDQLIAIVRGHGRPTP